MLRFSVPEEFRRHAAALVSATSGLTFGLSALGVSFTLNLFVEPLATEFGWSRQQILTVPLILSLAVLPSGLLVGWIADRIGVRRPILFSQCALGACFLGLGFATRTLMSFYLLYAAMAVLSAGTLPITFSKLLASRFRSHRGLALGIAQSGIGLCGVFAPAYVNACLERWGWRGAYVALGLLPLLVALPLSLALLPKENGPAAVEPPAPVAHARADERPWQALAGYRFWVMGGAFFLVSAAVTGVLTNLSPLLAARHFSRSAAAGLQGAFGALVILGRIGVGSLVDRFRAPWVGAGFLIPAGFGAWLLAGAVPGALDALPVLVIALATGAEVDLCAYLTSRYFPLRNYGKLYAAQFLLLALGGGLSAPLYGRLYDAAHNYDLILAWVGAGFIASGLLLLTLGRYPRHPDSGGTETSSVRISPRTSPTG